MKNAVAVFLAIVFVAACAGVGIWGTERLVAQAQPEEESDAEGPVPVRVTVARPEPGEIRDNYGALGTIRAARSVDLRPLAEARAAFERARAEVATAEAALGISGCGRLSTA